MARILVTGGAGFIGSHLVEHILKTTDDEVVVLDRLDETSTLHRVGETDAYQKNRHRVFFVWHDLRSPLSAYVADKLGSPHVIYHLAASTHVDRSIVDPLSFVQDNVMGTVNLMQWTRRLRELHRFVYFSTDEVFGPASWPVAIEHRNIKLKSNRVINGLAKSTYDAWDRYRSSNPYSASKAAAEEFVLAYHNTYNLPAIITHCVNAFGERQHPEKFLPLLIRRILGHELVYIHANSDKTIAASRQYVHARNIAAALCWLVAETENRPEPGAKVNLAGQIELDAVELTVRVAEILGIPPKFERVSFHASRPGHDMRYALVDDLKPRGFDYPVDFWESLERTVLWYRANPEWLAGGDPT